MHFVAAALALETFLVNFHLQIVTDRYSPGVVLDQHPNLTKKNHPKKMHLQIITDRYSLGVFSEFDQKKTPEELHFSPVCTETPSPGFQSLSQYGSLLSRILRKLFYSISLNCRRQVGERGEAIPETEITI